MAFDADQLAALEDAYTAGVLSVRHGDKTLVYPSMSDLWDAIVRLRAALRSSSRKHRAGVAGYKKFG